MVRRSGLLVVVVVFWMVAGAALHGQSTGAPAFAYSGDLGPGFWGEIAKECRTTATSRQSPIDIHDVAIDSRLKPLEATLPDRKAELVNTGYTLQAEPQPGGLLYLNDRTYSLAQFHFHTLAEHTVEGRRGVMEMHYVFKDSAGQLAVIGVLYRIGRHNRFLQSLISAELPRKSGMRVSIDRVALDEGLRNEGQTSLDRYYRYRGSLTIPDCGENVTWLVLKGWAELSVEQFEAFRTILGNDFRPLQARNGRKIRATADGPNDRNSGPATDDADQ